MTDIENSEPALVPITNRAPVRPDSPTFAELGVRAETVEALAKAGITRAFAIQEYALPIAMRGTDLIGQAPTGTGKTLGFGLPMLERLLAPSEGSDGIPQALVVVPTRELGLQVARDLAAAGSTRGVRVLPIYGGVAYEPQVDALKKGVEILVGTPGRLLDLAKQKQLKLAAVKTLVLDEADRMLDLGFLDDVEKILAMLPEQRQTMLFSATMPDPIVALSRRFLHHPVTIHAGHTAESGASPLTKQVVYRTHPLNKVEMVARMLQARGRGLTMIFTRTKRAADRLAEDLDFRGFAVAAVHGDLGQGARERALRAFRSGKIDVLVATDVAARGLDVSGVTHVINYDCPEDPETYTHRIGRTGRAGATGVAVTFVDWEDMPRWVLIDKTLGLGMPQPPETYHTSPALYSDLDIPTDISGTLPTADRSRVGLAAEIEEDLGGTGRRRERGGRPRRGRPEGPSSAPSSDGDDRPKRQRRRRRMDDDAPSGTASGPTSGTASGTASGAPESLAESSAATASGAVIEDAPAPRTRSRRRAVTEPASLESPGLESPGLESPGLESPSESADAPPVRSRSRRRVTESPSESAVASSDLASSGPASASSDLASSDLASSDLASSDLASSGPASSARASEVGTAPARSRRRVAAVPADASVDVEPGSDPTESAPRARTRRTAPVIAPLFSDGSAEVAGGSSPAAAASSDGEFDDAGDDADRPRRRRRRGARGNRGSGSGSAEMTGGSEAGVGTTADA